MYIICRSRIVATYTLQCRLCSIVGLLTSLAFGGSTCNNLRISIRSLRTRNICCCCATISSPTTTHNIPHLISFSFFRFPNYGIIETCDRGGRIPSAQTDMLADMLIWFQGCFLPFFASFGAIAKDCWSSLASNGKFGDVREERLLKFRPLRICGRNVSALAEHGPSVMIYSCRTSGLVVWCIIRF